MKNVYVRASMAAVQDGGRGRARNSRSMQPLGYYCFKCQQFWTDDQVYRIVEELREKRIQQYLSSPAAKVDMITPKIYSTFVEHGFGVSR